MRSLIAFPCAGETLIGTLDAALGATGLLIVSGGNEIRCGAHRGMALLAAEVAAKGRPVFRYDRRGIGDSTGANAGFLSARDDLIAAAAAFRAHAPHVTTIVGYGNCDAATTLTLYGHDAGIDRLLLANPWTIEDTDDLPPAAAIRATYRQRLTSPRAWARLLAGQIDMTKAIKGLRKASATRPQTFAARVVATIERWGNAATVLLATGDATAQAYRAAARHLPAQLIETASHSFARPQDQHRLRAAVFDALDAKRM
ncbi:hydrolase 1, exosortase A system-associated [Sphingomonas sp. RP10(2022)]|uniref:Hydrolase 1, exosortase A system-associated n=1 Tax=Sphingomonas liriopis TaxID=2949094 RepID=A0A9X2HQ69_9SPHN|nr:hydrolase 1, exosortase A system-associated [Sphingomonas liriopis]MCP3734462.1 hydrolase 1, exosortase A system-associated [Sphingomonas liriopis]